MRASNVMNVMFRSAILGYVSIFVKHFVLKDKPSTSFPNAGQRGPVDVDHSEANIYPKINENYRSVSD